MRTSSLRIGLLALAALLFHADAALGDTASCLNQGPPQAPVGGDELFFSTASAPPNVMVMLDTSGSMYHLPQCNGLSTGGSGAAGSPTVNWGDPGCDPVLGTDAFTCSVPWMDAFAVALTEIVDPYDPGVPASPTPYLTDAPTWNKDCTATNCGLFKSDRFYRYGEWNSSSAVERDMANACASTYVGSATLATECATCMASDGYFVSRNSGGAYRAVFRGAWLNKNPPKHVVARKVIKDLVRMSTADQPLDSVRFGLAVFDGEVGARVVVPLGPACDSAWSVNGIDKASYKPARQKIIDALNNPSLVAFAGFTPLAESLFDLGKYLSGGTYNGLVTGRSVTSPTLTDTDPGTSGASWASGNRSICWACQKTSIALVTDGAPVRDNDGLPSAGTGGFPGTDDAEYTTAARCGTGGTLCTSDGEVSRLPLVAKFLKTADLRAYANTPTASDPTGFQTATTYTISFGIADGDVGLRILQTAADMGGGTFNNTSSGSQLSSALTTVATATAQEANSFSASRASTLQTNTSGASLGETFLARFQPGEKQVAWQGHLLQAKLFDEFASGCDPTLPNSAQGTVLCGSQTVSVNRNGDESNGKAVCSGVFLVDQNCDPIFEDDKGQLKKGRFNSSGGVEAGTGSAAFFWDAGEQLNLQSSAESAAPADPVAGPSGRYIFTVVDTDGDRALTTADGRTTFTTANASTLARYLDLSGTWCDKLYDALSLPKPSTWTSDDISYCAEQVIWYVRGMDVLDFDKDGCFGPANAPTPPTGRPVSTKPNQPLVAGKGCADVTTGEERNLVNDSSGLNQFGKLGDIFHSIPVAVKPPVPAFVCDLNADTQCLGTIHGMKTLSAGVKTPLDESGGRDAYEQYRRDNIDRLRIVLAGANDGMLHAFHAGAPDLSGTTDLFGSHPYDEGTGKELWAFIPPDLLPRLKDSLFKHIYLVDGSPMVRDIWHDRNQDGRKQKGEFHTVAIVGERGGGTVYSALDVTDPLAPKFLWSFPPPGTQERLLAGQSWSEFAGRPPPIGPVRLDIPSSGGPADPENRGWEERWIVMLGGGFDPTLVKGRRVWMVDAWTGALVWRFSDEDFQTRIRDSSTSASMFPVAAAPGLLDIGAIADGGAGVVDSDGFFDTATWGDLGGNLWVARFHETGTLDSDGLVDNWFAARAFEQRRRTDGTQRAAGRAEFFQMTGNTISGDDQRLRTFIGGGNRARLLESGSHCSADDLMGCCRASCGTATATVTQSHGSGGCGISGTASCSSTTGIVLGIPSVSGDCDGDSCTALDANTSVTLQCGSTASATSTGATTCVEDATLGISTCSVESPPPFAGQIDLAGSSPQTRFYAVWSFGGNSARRFKTEGEARTFDLQRFTDVSYPTGCTAASGGNCTLTDVSAGATAASDAPGWFYQHGDACPLESSACTTTPWFNEKTATGGIPDAQGCVSWRTIRPTSAAGSPCSRSFGDPVSLTYLSDLTFGNVTTSCSAKTASGTLVRAMKRDSVAPPTERVARISVNARGEVQRSSMTFDQGQPVVTGAQARRSLVEPTFWLEAGRDLHNCRHVNAASCE